MNKPQDSGLSNDALSNDALSNDAQYGTPNGIGDNGVDYRTGDRSAVDYTDQRRPLQRALRLGWIGLIVVTVISLAVWGYVAELPGIWGVLIGAAIGGGFVLVTSIVVLLTANTTPATTGAVVLGSWLVKLLVVLGIFYILKGMDFYDTAAFVVTVIAAMVVVLGTEVYGVVTTNVTYVSPKD